MNSEVINSDNIRAVGVIPVKLNSERTPGKNIKALYDGTPLIHLVQKYMLRVDGLEKVYVYCSDEKVKKYLIEGVEYVQRDPVYDSPTADVIEMMRVFSEIVDADIYVQSHATVPFIKAESINEGLKAIKSGRYDSAIAAKTIQDFLWKNNQPFNYNLDNIPRTQDMEPFYAECGVYIYRNDVIKQKKRKIGDSPYLIKIDEFEAIDIDEPEDFIMADALYTYFKERMGVDYL